MSTTTSTRARCRHSFFHARLRAGRIHKTCQDCRHRWSEPAQGRGR